MAQLEIKKMKQGMSYSCKEKTIILNVFKYFRIQFPDKCVTDIVRRTAKATGCSEKSIFQFRKEEASAEGFKVPSTTKIRRNININSRDIKYDNTVRQAIRNIIYELKYKNVVPSLNTILKHVNGDPQLPNFSLMTLRRLLFDMGFCYEKNGNKAVLVEKTPPVKKDPKKENLGNNKAKKIVKPPQQYCQPVNPIPQNPPPQPPPINNHIMIQMPQHDNHMMHLPHHNMPMMLNHRMPPPHPMPPPNVNWMHPTHHAMMKQE
ncbi:uncharacterized protein LOC103312696 [Tribolium castaneum]|uniref:Uncharacterized protein n=1 Tax=Tribolium castaneum TaxID=7070 RepID=D2A088_TRICA|nr:PREDICTED: uncharacterized protein LOC103312696 [Tribolium castaneum]EFA02486.1 hypothetical protein TcasGA2_TC008181 [Tribolium castaneum]|eukprot:XP_008192256.1 PREDICTED: uncharacterized protein LOC103312696 [Tribolium castaneum]